MNDLLRNIIRAIDAPAKSSERREALAAADKMLDDQNGENTEGMTVAPQLIGAVHNAE